MVSLMTPTASAEPPFSDPNVPGPIRPRAGHVCEMAFPRVSFSIERTASESVQRGAGSGARAHRLQPTSVSLDCLPWAGMAVECEVPLLADPVQSFGDQRVHGVG